MLLLAAIGLAITFGVMGVINMAHGEMVMIGAYVTFVVQETIRTSYPGLFDYSLLIAVPLAFIVAGAIGILIERSIIRFLYGRPLETLLATWGLSLVLQQAVRTMFGPTNREVGNPSWMSGAFELGQITITYNRLWILCFTLAVFAILLAMLRYTSLGLEMRAVTQNCSAASAISGARWSARSRSASPTSSWSRSPAPCSARSPFWFSSSCSSRSARAACSHSRGGRWKHDLGFCNQTSLRIAAQLPLPLAGEGWGGGSHRNENIEWVENSSPTRRAPAERHSRSLASAFLSKNGRRRRPMLPRKRER